MQILAFFLLFFSQNPPVLQSRVFKNGRNVNKVKTFAAALFLTRCEAAAVDPE